MPENETETEIGPETDRVDDTETEIEDRGTLILHLLEEIEIEHAETLDALADR